MAANIELGEGRTLNPESYSQSASQSTSTTNQESQTGAVLDKALLETILSGLTGRMTDEEIASFAESLLRPQLNAELEAAQQNLETTRLGLEQEQENLASELARAITEQQNAYRQSMAGVETAALARGMGRSSYTLQTLAGQGNALAEVVRQLTDESARQSAQLQSRITQAEQQAAKTQGRLNTDYASNLAAKIQELRQNQQQAYNQNYLTAVSASLGSKSTNTSTTTGVNTGMNVSGKIAGEDNGGGGGEKKSSGSGAGWSNTYDHL